ncbi:MAG TPA: radical SAM protein, partial [Coxiellaceae bacterium]|nr:radical SAM protein [Coxiellaceae bacterium]
MNNAIPLESLAGCLSNQQLGLILMPTEKCNFRCTYCYEDFSIGKMPINVVEGIKQLLNVRAPELKTLNIEWFGGEPLAAKNVVYDISEHAHHLKRDYPYLQYSGSMTTNGFNLAPRTFEKLIRYDVRSFQISLDGPREWHNQTRKRINGGASFDVIWNNLKSAAKTRHT